MNLGLHLQKYTYNGEKWSFVGMVPDALYFAEGATQDQINKAKQFGERFGPGRRFFETKEEAIKTAEKLGYKINSIDK